jgi:hypothetical protein
MTEIGPLSQGFNRQVLCRTLMVNVDPLLLSLSKQFLFSQVLEGKKLSLSHKIVTSKYFAFGFYRRLRGRRILTKMGRMLERLARTSLKKQRSDKQVMCVRGLIHRSHVANFRQNRAHYRKVQTSKSQIAKF